MKIILEKEKPISWNLYYGGMHWTKRQQEVIRVHDLVMLSTYNQFKDKGALKRFTQPVNITITAYFKKQLQDADNICAKLYIDGLKYYLLEDDNPEWVHSVTTRSKKDKENPRVEIDIDIVS